MLHLFLWRLTAAFNSNLSEFACGVYFAAGRVGETPSVVFNTEGAPQVQSTSLHLQNASVGQTNPDICFRQVFEEVSVTRCENL